MTIGKGTLSLRKKDSTTQKSVGLGLVDLVFATKATGGETSISLSALNTPSEMSSNGFTNPSPGSLSDANIYLYKSNLVLTSSLRGVLIQDLSYQIASNNLINFINFTLEPNEIIVGNVKSAARNGLQVVDAEAINATGTLVLGATDFNVGTPFETNKYPLTQIGAVLVFRNGIIQARCESNNIANDGNYIEVPVPGGLGTLIRFKLPAVNQADNIVVVSNGLLVNRPTDSMLATIERLAGVQDRVVQVLADAAGVTTTSLQAAPNNVDLKQFGDTVISNTNRITALEAAPIILSNGSAAGASLNNGFTYAAPTNNSINLTPGIWDIRGNAFFNNNGSNPGYTNVRMLLFAAQGTNTGVSPTSFTPAQAAWVGGVDTFTSYADLGSSASTYFSLNASGFLEVFSTFTIYLVPAQTVTTGTNARISAFISARKVA